MKTEIPDPTFGPLLQIERDERPAPMKVLLPIDGSAASVAAVQDVAHCPLPPGSMIELLYAIHSRMPTGKRRTLFCFIVAKAARTSYSG